MRFVPVKTGEQPSRLMVYRARRGFVGARTATINRIRGLMSEFGMALPQKAEVVRREARDCTAAQQLMQLMGVGQTTATAMVAMVGHGAEFSSGRQFAAWIGLVPGQYSSGGKARLGRINKAGAPTCAACCCPVPERCSTRLRPRPIP